MPELPEVETVRRGLTDRLKFYCIQKVEVLRERTIASPGGSEEFQQQLKGSYIGKWERRGKYLIAALHQGILDKSKDFEKFHGWLGVHLRMTGQFQLHQKPLQLRRMAMHLAHLGILLLLVGHVFTTTLVQRGDPSHIVMLAKDTPIEHNGYWYTFTELDAYGPNDEQWDENVGDGKILVTVEVRKESDGDIIATMNPGMLRFDEGGISARAETDIWHRPHGDLVMIFDQSQANQLYLTSFMQHGESVDRIRVVIYDLTGSHLVWAGWSLILIGTALTWIMVPPSPKEEEE